MNFRQSNISSVYPSSQYPSNVLPTNFPSTQIPSQYPGVQIPTNMQQPMQIPHMELVHTLHKCAASCFHTMSEVIGYPDVNRRTRQIKILDDCARICESQAAYTVMNSVFARQHASMCAMVCEECAKECAKFTDQISQHCSQMCYECAMACRQYAGMM